MLQPLLGKYVLLWVYIIVVANAKIATYKVHL